jgi:hypothetical protein
MKFFRLLTPSYLPGKTIDLFETLVWSERYEEAGDFKLVTKNDISIISILPLESLVSHTDTNEVMIVENYEIVRDKEKNLITTVTGRSFETFAENRVTYGSELPIVNPVGEAAYVEVTAPMPSCEAATALLRVRMDPRLALSADAIPNLLVEEDVRVHDTAMAHTFKRGNVYSAVLELLKMSSTGIKAIRPNGSQTTMNIIVHDGYDRRTSVIFYAQYEDLDDAKYFMSIKDYKNYARVATHITNRLYRHRDLPVDLTGLDRRVIYEAADELEGTYSPETSTDVVAARGQAVLDEHKQISLIQAKISPTATPKFKIDYEVGDIVTVFGEFATAQVMRVTEHILTVDKNGILGYPALTSL